MRNQKAAKKKNVIHTLEQKLSDYPQIGAVILDGLVVACSRISEILNSLEKQLKEKAEEIRNVERPHVRTQRSANSPV